PVAVKPARVADLRRDGVHEGLDPGIRASGRLRVEGEDPGHRGCESGRIMAAEVPVGFGLWRVAQVWPRKVVAAADKRAGREQRRLVVAPAWVLEAVALRSLGDGAGESGCCSHSVPVGEALVLAYVDQLQGHRPSLNA